MIETEVLIVGSGPAGSAAALSLSAMGVPNIVATRHRWLANTPRAHITNQRAMEIFRDLGVEEEVAAKATPRHLMGNNVFCESLAGEELGRLYSWGNHPARTADYDLASPTAHCDCPQDLLEPILIGAAAARGTQVRFFTEYLSLKQDAAGVTAVVRDRADGREYPIRAKYLVGADGGNSKVAEDVGLPVKGKMGVAGSMNIVFNADLSPLVAHRPSVLYWVLQPGSDVGGIGMGLVRMVRPWNEWLIVWGYDINDKPPKVDERAAVAVARGLIGDDSIPIKIRSTSVWTVNHAYAARNTAGRVFCMGDAVHRHPPSNGLGSNTSIQDAHNLAWKLALVLRGSASPSLLETYDAERSPVAKQIVDRANKSIREFGPIFEALGLTETRNVAKMRANMEARKKDSPKAAKQREKLRRAILFKSYEFNCHGVEMNQRYRSAAVVSDGTPEPEWRRDPELYFQPSTRPGAHLPHAWLGREGRKISTLDLAGKGRFSLFTGIGGDRWVAAARAVSKQFGAEIAAHVVGPGREHTDLYGAWADLRETAESGCVLVRPDGIVGWRSARVSADAKTRLARAMAQILGRKAR